ncbi:MAG: trypsin-like serine protease [Bacteroidota bacterium]|nr:trypsin-like serine protease [Bacteroidota bacterium]
MKLILYTFLIGIINILPLGIYRHNVPIEKYMQLARESKFDCVGKILYYENDNLIEVGSCVLIDSQYVLSAAHCFIGENTKDTTIDYDGKKMKTYIVTGQYKKRTEKFVFEFNNKRFTSKRIVVHEKYMAENTHDIALIELNEPVKNISFPLLNKEFNEKGDSVTGVGFGVSGPANRPELVDSYGIKLAGMNIIDSIGGYIVNGQSALLFTDFDSPDKLEDCNKMGDSAPLPFEYFTGGGDSGGGLFREQNETLQLIGICVGSPKDINILLKHGYYCQISCWTRISVFREWITQNQNK